MARYGLQMASVPVSYEAVAAAAFHAQSYPPVSNADFILACRCIVVHSIALTVWLVIRKDSSLVKMSLRWFLLTGL